ncbi:MAG: competence/damage-inducible protein A, partial [Alphaproteobacteria bacterium]|nr:competence/damage-inducible protein A [Alphaproteobacteria bacterium]
MQKTVRAAIVIIGNEILSGKTADKNVQFLSTELNNLGIRVSEVRMIMDIESEIMDTVLAMSKKYDYVFTTGGIGPTHDDITSASIAKAFGRKLLLDQCALECLRLLYKEEEINEARIRMAYIPENCELIENPMSHAPGFILENIHVMAGVPRIMQSMFSTLKGKLKGGEVMKSQSVTTFLTEGLFALDLENIQENNKEVEIGSYPFAFDGKRGTTLIVSGYSDNEITKAYNDIVEMIKKLGGELVNVPEEAK